MYVIMWMYLPTWHLVISFWRMLANRPSMEHLGHRLEEYRSFAHRESKPYRVTLLKRSLWKCLMCLGFLSTKDWKHILTAENSQAFAQKSRERSVTASRRMDFCTKSTLQPVFAICLTIFASMDSLKTMPIVFCQIESISGCHKAIMFISFIRQAFP